MSDFRGFEKSASLPIPPGFLDRVVARENGSVIRVVAFVLARSLQGHSTVVAGYRDFMHEMKLSRQAVQEGLARALEAGYIRVVRQGGGLPSSYALNWLEDDTPEDPPPDPTTPGSGQGSTYQANPAHREDPAWKADYPLPPDPSVNQTALSRPAFQAVSSTSNPSLGSSPAFQTGSRDSRISLEKVEVEQKVELSLPARNPVHPRSIYLTGLTGDFSLELGDLCHLRSNLTQTHNLWLRSGLSEQDFAALLYRARDLTRRFAVHRPGETPPPPGLPRNRMAYFFTVLQNMVDNPGKSFRGKPGFFEDNRAASPSIAKSSGYALADYGRLKAAPASRQKAANPAPVPRAPLPVPTTSPRPVPASWRRILAPVPLDRYLAKEERL